MIVKDMEFDVRIARLSVLVDALGYAIMAATTSPATFYVASVLASLGGGAPPAIQSLSLCLLPNPREDAGKMFGALSMMQAVGSAIASVCPSLGVASSSLMLIWNRFLAPDLRFAVQPHCGRLPCCDIRFGDGAHAHRSGVATLGAAQEAPS